MIFFGWGRKNKSAQLDGKTVLLRTWGYFHLFWLLRVWGRDYSLATATPDGWATRALTDAEVAAIGEEAKRAVTPNWWWRFGLFIGLGMLALFITIMTLTQG
ncbi:hypothetical protein [Myceligenerans salitolerans]|uniref:Uncharacterized protein n=1 Tax=Myceligenerans salitolerans TaxID=1230528 RepID=A0ABS3I9V4_9MICO|nr:hypothetical protein [Myceligenerans salitolerans]MBO0609743.1 hypothetical protein [Myceligenerans salitolerans]